MKKLVFLSVIILACIISSGNAQDVKGSKDHPLITRYPGAQIAYYEEQKFQPYKIAIGPVTGYKKIDKWIDVEGKFTRIYYTIKGTTTLNEVFANYKSALKKGGFKTLAEGINATSGVAKEVGGRGFLNPFYEANPYPSNGIIKINQGSSSSAGACYIAAELEQSGSKVYIVVGGSQYASNEKVFMVDIIEQTMVEDDLIKVNATLMKNKLTTDGKIALYGIYFDFDKAEVKSESASTLSEIAKLLKDNPQLKIFVVGHTDMKGTFEYNLTLSKNRAASVVTELTTKYGISASRLTPDGVGPLSPVSSNENENGRKLNRRVELVVR